MIKYSVQCQKGHGFEGWFKNSDAYDRQSKRGQITCPDCGSTRVTKALMAPNILAKTRRKGSATAQAARPSNAAGGVAARPVASASVAMPSELKDLLRHIRREVAANAEYVGPRFAEEARKIHFDEAPERGIYGEASPEDVEALLDDGIDCLPLPILPEDRN